MEFPQYVRIVHVCNYFAPYQIEELSGNEMRNETL